MLRLAISCLALTLTAPSLFAEARLAAPTATAPTEAVNWTAGVSYSYDGSGNITAIGSDRFAYDHVGRLTRATINGVDRAYAYDVFGNRTECTHAPDKPERSDCQSGIEIETASNRMRDVKYNASGSVEEFAGHRYMYDTVNMPVRDDRGNGLAKEFIYTADDERLATYTTGSTWNWTLRDTNGKILREFTSDAAGSFAWGRDYVYRSDLLVASVQPSSNDTVLTYHYHLDHLGTARRITDHTNRTVGFHDYYAFGPEISGGLTEPLPAPLQYTGHERDKWGGIEGLDTLDYMHARYYSPAMGRFLTIDPAASSARPLRPQTWNRYTYAFNNPLNLVDPDGAAPKSPPDIEIARHTLHLDYSEINDRNPLPHVDVTNPKGKKIGRLRGFFDVLNGEVPNSVMKGLKDAFDRKALSKAWLRGLSKWGAKILVPVGIAAEVVFTDPLNADDDRQTIERFINTAQAMFDKPVGKLTDKERQQVWDVMTGRQRQKEPERQKPKPKPAGACIEGQPACR